LIAALIARGYRVVAMAHLIDPTTRDRLISLGAEPREVSLINNSTSLRGTADSVRALIASFREIRPDTIIAYTVKPVTLGAIAAAHVGVPSFVPLVTGLGFAFTKGPGIKRRLSRLVASLLYRCAFRRSHAIVFQNSDDLEEFRARPARAPHRSCCR